MFRMLRVRTHLGRPFQLQTQHRRITKGFQPSPATDNVLEYVMAAGTVVAMGALWLLIPSLSSVPRLESQPSCQVVFESDASKSKVARMVLQDSYSVTAKNIAGVERFDGTQLFSNNPCGDRFTFGLISPWQEQGGTPWLALGLFDGHTGWQTAEFLETNLLKSVQHSLGQVKPPLNGEITSEQTLHNAIKKSFFDLDSSIFKAAEDASESKLPLQEKVRIFAPAFAGSCALLSLYDPTTSRLHVACAGNSRAVLGQSNSDGKWETILLSTDQTNSNDEAEVAKLNAEHPGEERIARNGWVLGRAVSQSGPGALSPKHNIQTPPYITAAPVVRTTAISVDRPSFLIMATDGLWDYLSSQDAVDLVAAWLDSKALGAGMEDNRKLKPPQYAPFDVSNFRKGVSQGFVKKRMIIQDENAAGHLLQNCMSGNTSGLRAGRLVITPPYSRDRRDDITIQVVFFNTETTKRDKGRNSARR